MSVRKPKGDVRSSGEWPDQSLVLQPFDNPFGLLLLCGGLRHGRSNDLDLPTYSSSLVCHLAEWHLTWARLAENPFPIFPRSYGRCKAGVLR